MISQRRLPLFWDPIKRQNGDGQTLFRQWLESGRRGGGAGSGCGRRSRHSGQQAAATHTQGGLGWGATSQAGVMTAKRTPRLCQHWASLETNTHTQSTVQSGGRPRPPLLTLLSLSPHHSEAEPDLISLKNNKKPLETKTNLQSDAVSAYFKSKKKINQIVYTIPGSLLYATFIICKTNAAASDVTPAEPVNSLVLSHRMPIDCTYQRKWCGPGPSQAILSPLLGLKQNWKITLLALTVHLNHFNTIIIMRLSNIIFKSLGEEKNSNFISFA